MFPIMYAIPVISTYEIYVCIRVANKITWSNTKLSIYHDFIRQIIPSNFLQMDHKRIESLSN